MRFIAVDIGNSRLKWALCDEIGILETAALADDPSAWDSQSRAWDHGPAGGWVVASVHPERAKRFAEWAGFGA